MKEIDTSTWGEFRIGELFEVVNGRKYPMTWRVPGSIPLVSTSGINNGVTAAVGFPDGSDYVTHSNLITVAYSGSVGATFYHEDAVFVGETAMGLLPREGVVLNRNTGLFLSAVIYAAVKDFTYDRKLKVSEMRKEIAVLLPITSAGEPDWDYMEQTMREVLAQHEQELDELIALADSSNTEIDTSDWREFRIGSLFPTIERATRRTINSYADGNVPYVTNSIFNNGISGYLEPKSSTDIEHGHCISINTVDGYAFWQEQDFLANSSGNGLLMLRNDSLDRNRALFVCAAITTALDASYTVMLTMDTIRDVMIRLPVTSSGDPDWDYMEQTMRDAMAEREAALDSLQVFAGV
ncbi:hypothetical protein F8O06_05400 [Pseudoclavibacter sp. CFCC 14310]|uniref:restriction endonuclease subunit S n=1 Tax=Pseudoclavibacter sp. CFCC 14310 TaxID=2615180 RepID=UPI0013018C1B|nr:restriction endonuclease subunit S [Pseudoclavibacter sp. CFCC 14310]KAB1646202.1 hypothetical protein F8O06_05400 [Pseudoclavibacter sp. CFCC 14310]